MRDLDRMLEYSHDKVRNSQLPLSLYQRAERRALALDFMVAAIVVGAVLFATSMQFTGKATADTVAVREIAKQTLVATKEAK